MTSATATTAPDFTVPLVGGRNHFLLRRLHSLTGLVFGGYIVVHLIVNASLIQGGGTPDVFQAQVNKIHDLPFLIAVEWGAIFIPFLFHLVYGTWVIFSGQPNVLRYSYAKNWFYVLQRASAIVLVFFILFHVLAMKGLFGGTLQFEPAQATASVRRHMTAAPLVGYVIYPIGIIASCYHLANGFWTAAITWGLTISAAAQRRWGYACVGIFALTLGCGFLALIAAVSNGAIVIRGLGG